MKPLPAERIRKGAILAALAALIGWHLYWTIPIALEGRIYSDGSLYLDIARNIREGRGAILGINYFQDFGGPYVSGLAYHQFGYSLFALAVWKIHYSTAAVLVATSLLAAVSLVLYYRLCRRFFAPRIALVSTVLLGISAYYQTASVLPMTEQLHFFLLMVGLLLLWTENASPWRLAAAGLVMAGALVARIAHVFSLAATLVWERRRLFFLVSVLAIAEWEILCWIFTGWLYPGYGRTGVWADATWFVGGYYSVTEPHLRWTPPDWGTRVERFLLAVPRHLAGGFAGLVINSGLAMAALPFFLARRPWQRLRGLSQGSRLFLTQVVVCMAGYAVWMSREPHLDQRYFLLPLAFSLPPLFEALLGLEWCLERRHAAALLTLILGVGLLRSYWYGTAQPAWTWRLSGTQQPRAEAYAYIRTHSSPDDLVASNEVGFLYDVERPAVSLPRGFYANPQNVVDFLRLFRPTWICITRQPLILNESWNPIYNRVLEEHGFRLVYSSFGFWTYRLHPPPPQIEAPQRR